MTDQTPRTEAGRRLLIFIDDIGVKGDTGGFIAAIEAEAAAQARTEALDVAFMDAAACIDASDDISPQARRALIERVRAILAGETE